MGEEKEKEWEDRTQRTAVHAVLGTLAIPIFRLPRYLFFSSAASARETAL